MLQGSSKHVISSNSWSCTSRTRFKYQKPKSYTTLKRMATRHLEQQTREKHVSTRDRLGETQNTVVLAVEGKRKRRKKKKIAIKVSTKGQCSRGHACCFKHDPTEKGISGSKKQRIVSPGRRKSSDRDDITRKSSVTDGEQRGTSPSEASDTPLFASAADRTSVTKEKRRLYWHPLARIYNKGVICNSGKYVSFHFEKDKSRLRQKTDKELIHLSDQCTHIMRGEIPTQEVGGYPTQSVCARQDRQHDGQQVPNTEEGRS